MLVATLVGALAIAGFAMMNYPGADAATDTTTVIEKQAYMTTENCAVPNDNLSACERNDNNNGAGPNTDPAIYANVTFTVTKDLDTGLKTMKVEGSGSGFVNDTRNVSELLNVSFKDGTVPVQVNSSAPMYFTLIYWDQAEERCGRITGENGQYQDNDFASMFGGYWDIDDYGNGNISFRKQAPIGNITEDDGPDGFEDYFTASVRRVGFNSTAFNATKDVPPQLFQLRACGDLVTTSQVG